jgi:segregation and condensation protein B
MRPELRLLEAVLFAAGRPVSERELAAALSVRVLEVRSLLAEYRALALGRGFALHESEAGAALVVAPDLAQAVAQALDLGRDPLTPPVLEVLAIIAEHQPVDRGTIEAIRGVRSDRSLAILQEEGLIEEAGRGAGPGRPVLWRTTPEFLARFGLGSVAELLAHFPKASDA